MNLQNAISIDGWQIDANSYRISRAGVEKKLEPRSMELLLYLAERPNQVVTRREIEDDVWQGRVVGYDALSGAIAKIRKTFEDTDKNHRVIETISKAGYRLIAPVLIETDDVVAEIDTPDVENFERKLSAIFYADVAEYSRLTGEDEDRTHRQLRQNMKTVSQAIVGFHGRIVHYAGDAVLAEFATASAALHCALVAQQEISEINSHLPESQRVLFRIGVNLGEVIVDGEEIYGDGVNVAARLESMAAPGSVCISGAVFDAIGQKQGFDFEYQGEKTVKNILHPVRTYGVHLKEGASIPTAEPPARKQPEIQPQSPPRITPGSILGLVSILITLAVVGFLVMQSRSSDMADTGETAAGYTDPAIPSLAILPFRNTSNDPGQTVYSDGLTDDLITDLSNIDGLRVTPRHASFRYRNTELAVKSIANELRVRYIVQGSVRRSQEDIRVNVQLIDTRTDQQIWAERFDDRIEKLFKLQDQLISKILLEINLEPDEKPPSTRRTTNLEAYDYFLRAEHRRLNGRELFRDGMTLRFYQKAIELDPEFVAAYTGLAREALVNWQVDASQVMPAAASRKLVYETAGKALELDPDNAEALAILGLIQAISGAHDTGIMSVKNAIALDPSNPELHADLAEVLSYGGFHKAALESINTAIDSHVAPPTSYFAERAYIYFFLGRFENALEDLEKSSGFSGAKELWILVYGALNDRAKAKPWVDARLKSVAWFNLEYYRVNYVYYRRAADIELLINSFAKAGIPRFAYGFDPGDREPVDNSGIQALVERGLWHGNTYDGGEFFQQFTGSDRVALRNPVSMMSGNYHIENDKLCVTYQSVLLDLPDCGYIYADADASSYHWVTLGEVYRFSVE
jgi:adenylate cyclase